MANERVTENFVRDHFREHATPGQLLEEQVSTDPAIARALKVASKHGGGSGKPEFLVTYAQWPEGVIVVECKADTAHHESASHKAGTSSTVAEVTACAVDGVLHYAKHLAKYLNVIAVAVSGQKKSALRVSTYRHLKGAASAEPLYDRAGNAVQRLRTVADYNEFFRFDPAVVKTNIERLVAHTRFVHNFLRDYAKVTEPEKPLVVSAVLLALRHTPFRTAWSVASDADLAAEMFEAIDKVVKKAISGTKKELMMAAYEFVRTHPELTKKTKVKLKGQPEVTTAPLRFLIDDLQREVLPFAEAYPHFDVIGQFYAEFLRYTGGEGQGLGIVLTPRHLTELFVQVAQVTRHDTVVDSCAGTGGFLISSMIEMDRQIGDDPEAKKEIREQQLIGIEQRSDMFALCVSNMILRGDGRSNLYRGDCFDEKLQRQIVQPRNGMKQPNKGLLNPPYSQKGEDQHELDFVKAMVDMLAPGGTAVTVVPMSCAISPHPLRARLLEAHTLVAVMSLPDELFYPVGTFTCALVLRAHTPHAVANSPTWFGYWRDDGFLKLKHLGRVDYHDRWPKIRDQWLADYRSLAVVPGRCVKKVVKVDDEWCAEAYLETDYSAITKGDFERVVREYALFALGQHAKDEGADAEGI